MIRALGASGAVALALAAAPTTAQGPASPTPTSELLRQDVLVDADLWDTRPRMMAAGLGFTDIVGTPGLTTQDLAGSERAVHDAGGAWNTVRCAEGTTPDLSAYTSASTPQQVAGAYGFEGTHLDGLPVEFSWPIRPSTLGPADFEVVLNDSSRVTPQLAAVYPNSEYGERSVAVLFGVFGNRRRPGDAAALYPVRTRVVADDTPLQLVGPGGPVSAVGLSAKAPGTPYDDRDAAPAERTGPRLIAAKLTRMSTTGEGAPKPFSAALPNDGVALYGKRARWRLRVDTTGGFSPDGVRAVFPTDFARHFRLRAADSDGKRVLLTRTGVDYRLPGGHVRILGLADLGPKAARYDDCYREDKDNFIDIVLDGDRKAVGHIRAVEIPASGRYEPFYNPGGPGNRPAKGVRYTSPGPRQTIAVRLALDDPLTVTFRRSGS